MESTGAFDKIWVDKMGNLLGQVGKPGKGKKLIAIDAHVDTVGVGNREEWKHDPYKGKVADGRVWGRGAGRPGRRDPRDGLRGQDSARPQGRHLRVLPAAHLHRDGRRLRRPLLAVHRQGRQDHARCRGRHRLDRLHDLPRPARPHGNRRHLPRQLVPRLDAREGRQRRLQNRQGRPRDRRTPQAAQATSSSARARSRSATSIAKRRASAPCRARPTSISIAASPWATPRNRPSPK